VPTLPPDNKEFLTLSEAAGLLCLSTVHTRRLCKDGRIPYSQPTRRILIRRADLEAFIDKYRHESTE